MALRNLKKKILEKRVGKGQVVQPNEMSWDKLKLWGKWDKGKGRCTKTQALHLFCVYKRHVR